MKTFSATIALFTDVGFLIKSRLQRSLPLPFAQCQTLSFVAERQHPNMRDVARHFKIAAPSATFLVDELARGGLIKRRADSTDRRKIELELTAKGKTTLKTYMETRHKVLNRMFKALSESDRADLNRILTKILASA